jgi:hypothetical protein
MGSGKAQDLVMTDQAPAQAKLSSCDVGPFRLPGVSIDTMQFTEEEVDLMLAWAKENHAYVTGRDLISWRSIKHRDWFILKWT